jgi:Hermes transposase DNA-binding domain
MKKKLVQWIVINQHPFTIVQEAAFIEFIKTFSPNAKIPAANAVKNNIMDFYLVEQEKIQEILQNTKGRISFTTDIWTSVSMKAFMVITAYYIDEEWKLQNIVIDFV